MSRSGEPSDAPGLYDRVAGAARGVAATVGTTAVLAGASLSTPATVTTTGSLAPTTDSSDTSQVESTEAAPIAGLVHATADMFEQGVTASRMRDEVAQNTQALPDDPPGEYRDAEQLPDADLDVNAIAESAAADSYTDATPDASFDGDSGDSDGSGGMW